MSNKKYIHTHSVAISRKPARTLGIVIANKTYVYPGKEPNLGVYDPLSDAYYADTAYTGMKAPDQVYANLNNDQEYPKKHFPRLDWYPEIKGNDYIATNNTNMYRTAPIGKEDKGFIPLRKTLIDRQQHTHQIKYFGSQRNTSSKFYLLAAIGYIMFKFFPLILLFAVIFLGYIMGLYDTWQGFFLNILYVGLMSVSGFIIWKSSVWIAERFPDNKFRKLNRVTGMVCIPQRGKKPDIEIPFSEFEPRLLRKSSPSGFYHGLIYVHKTGKPLFPVGCRFIGDAYTFAAYLEQFMDITKPLPDIPPLEWCRDKDPTTAAYDEATGRDPYYWRNKTEQEIDKIRDEHQEKIKSIISQHAYNL